MGLIVHIPKTLIDDLILRTNIVDLINRKIPLKKQGGVFLACCPFHFESNPSFTVNFEKQFYYCFSCKAYGNVINFLMNYEKLTFLNSIKELSAIHNIKIENFLNINNNKNYHHKDNLYQFMNDLCMYYQKNLMNKKYLHVYQYLQNRGLTHDMICHFKIGFAPIGWNNIECNFSNLKYNQSLINQSGMLVINNLNNKYDRFRNRIIFPIHNRLGQVIAFGGRIIHNIKNTPKYLNSPDTEIFKKNKCLYGFYEIYTQQKKVPHILLVEGYMDVITLTQFGINYTVAALGTTININHIQLIYSITNKIICCYDGDNAGKIAAWNTLKIILPYLTDDRQIYFMFLPNGTDPDSLIHKIGKDNFLKKQSQAQDLAHFLFDTLSKKVNLQTLEGRVQLGKLSIPILNKIPGQTLKLCLLQYLGNKIGILDSYKLNQLLKSQPTSNKDLKTKNNIKYNITNILISLLLKNPTLAKLAPITPDTKQLTDNKIIILIDLIKICKYYPTFTTNQLLQYYYKNNKNNFTSQLETLACWNHMITDNMIKITFVDALTKLYNLILEKRQNALIAKDRISKLTMQERQELWLLNQKLSIH